MVNNIPFYIEYICKEYLLDLNSILNLEITNSKIKNITGKYRDSAIFASLSKIYKYQNIKLTKLKFNKWYNIFEKCGLIDYIIFITYTNIYISNVILKIGIKTKYEFADIYSHNIPCRIPLNPNILYNINEFYRFNNKISSLINKKKCYFADICSNYETKYFKEKYKFNPTYNVHNKIYNSVFNIIYLIYNFNFWQHHKLIDYINPYPEFNLDHYPLLKTEMNDSILIFKKYIFKNYWNIFIFNLNYNHL